MNVSIRESSCLRLNILISVKSMSYKTSAIFMNFNIDLSWLLQINQLITLFYLDIVMDKLDNTSTYVHEEYRQVVSEHLCYIMRNMSTRSYIGYQKA